MSECALDLRGRSHVGHILTLEIFFFLVLHHSVALAFPNKRLHLEGFYLDGRARDFRVYFASGKCLLTMVKWNRLSAITKPYLKFTN